MAPVELRLRYASGSTTTAHWAEWKPAQSRTSGIQGSHAEYLSSQARWACAILSRKHGEHIAAYLNGKFYAGGSGAVFQLAQYRRCASGSKLDFAERKHNSGNESLRGTAHPLPVVYQLKDGHGRIVFSNE